MFKRNVGADAPISRRAAPIDPVGSSWWYRDSLEFPGSLARPPLAAELQVDVAIVGGGFTGLWTALALKERDPALKVALIEAGRCGSGASGKSGGKVHGYWASLGAMAQSIGDDNALAMARAGTRAQDAIRKFATSAQRDVWWREDGNLRVSTTPAQDAKIDAYVGEARRLEVPDQAQRLSARAVQARCASPVFRGGVYFPEGANLHPGRLIAELRAAVIASGVDVFEQTPMIGLSKGSTSEIRTPGGRLVAREVVLATSVELAAEPTIQPHLSVFSSYALMTEPAPEQLARMGWSGNEGISDLRMFLHYFRRTADGRVLLGSGTGPIAFNGRTSYKGLVGDRRSAARTQAGLRRLLPALEDVAVESVWGGANDVSADRLPFFGTFPGTRVHFGCGYSGHGLNAAYIGGQCLASLVLSLKDEWACLPLCTRQVPRLPKEPFRTLGGRVVRWGVIRCEEADERGERAALPARAMADLPRLLGLKVGTR